MALSPAREAFWSEIQQPAERIDLARAALAIAREEYPDLDPEPYLARLDAMAEAIAPALPPERYPLRVLQAISRHLFEELGFRGNRDRYYDPRNSFFNDVLDRRTGIPITLSLVYLEVARRLDFPMVGVGMPGHFIIRPDREEMELFVDAFAGGEILFPQDCADRLAQIYGQPAILRPEFLQPVDTRRFLVRMLTNLKAIYVNGNDVPRALAAVERILLLVPDTSGELRDRGLLYYQLDRWGEARRDLETYLARVPDAGDRPWVRQLLDRLGEAG